MNAVTGMGIILAIVSLNYVDNSVSRWVTMGLAIGLGGLGIIREMKLE